MTPVDVARQRANFGRLKHRPIATAQDRISNRRSSTRSRRLSCSNSMSPVRDWGENRAFACITSRNWPTKAYFLGIDFSSDATHDEIDAIDNFAQFAVCQFEYNTVDALLDEHELDFVWKAPNQIPNRKRIEAELDFIIGQ